MIFPLFVSSFIRSFILPVFSFVNESFLKEKKKPSLQLIAPHTNQPMPHQFSWKYDNLLFYSTCSVRPNPFINIHTLTDILLYRRMEGKETPELSDSKRVLLRNWSETVQETMTTFIDSYDFRVANGKWRLRIYPHEKYDGDDYVGVSLINMSDYDVKIKYSITLINQSKKEYDLSKSSEQNQYQAIYNDIKWTDPEGKVLFQRFDPSKMDDCDITFHGLRFHETDCGMDNEWGNNHFISVAEFVNESFGYYRNDQYEFQVDVEYYGDCIDLDGQPWTKNVMKAENNNDLISLANKDLSKVIQQLSKTVTKQTFYQSRQDSILENRLSSGQFDDSSTDVHAYAYHVYTSRLGPAASKISKTLESSAFISSITNPSKHRRNKVSTLKSPIKSIPSV